VGESPSQPIQLSFNASLKIDFQGSRVTSDAGLILVRELDERLGFGELIRRHLTDSRHGKNTQFPFADLLRQSVYSCLAGYEDLNDAERLSQDPTFRLIGSEKIWDRGAALTSRLQSFETEMLAEEQNFAGLAALNRALIGKAEAVDSSWRTILDMDSTEGPVYSQGFCPGTNHTTLQCPHVGHPTCFSTRPRRLKTRKTRGGHRIRLCANNFSCTDGLLPVFQPFERRFLLSNIAKPLLSRIVASPGLMGGRSLSLPAYPGVILARWGQERAGEGPLLQGRLP